MCSLLLKAGDWKQVQFHRREFRLPTSPVNFAGNYSFSVPTLKPLCTSIDAKFAHCSANSPWEYFSSLQVPKHFFFSGEFRLEVGGPNSRQLSFQLFSAEKKKGWLARTREKLLRALGRVRTYMIRAQLSTKRCSTSQYMGKRCLEVELFHSS